MVNMNKKAQIDGGIGTLILIVISILVVAPLILLIVMRFQSGITTSLANTNVTGSNQAVENINATINPFIDFWDKVLFAYFIGAAMYMLIASFFIDTHPIFAILYIIAVFFMVILSPSLLNAVDQIYNNASLQDEVQNLAWLDSLRQNFSVYLLGFILLNGIIMFGKFTYFPSQGGFLGRSAR